MMKTHNAGYDVGIIGSNVVIFRVLALLRV